MSTNPKVSILMPVRNAETFLADTLTSILKQDYPNWELLMVDDFSTDSSYSIMQAFVQKDKRLHCFKNNVKGIIPALQLAFDESQGECITRMDADDLMPVSKLSNFVRVFNANPAAVITGKVQYFSDDAVSVGYKRYEQWLNHCADKGEFWLNIYRECVIASPNWMVSRICFENRFSFSDLVYPEDYDMVFKWYELGYEVKSVPAITHFWREHEARTSRNVADYQQEAFFKLKTNRFVDFELHELETVQLIGAGNKGKMVADVLLNRDVSFKWFDVAAKNYKAPILNQAILPVNALRNDVKSILTVWPTEIKKQLEIANYLSKMGLVFGQNLWLF